MLLVVLLMATFAIPISAVVVQPFYDPRLDISFTGLSMKTFMENLMPRFTKGAAGSQIPGKLTAKSMNPLHSANGNCKVGRISETYLESCSQPVVEFLREFY